MHWINAQNNQQNNERCVYLTDTSASRSLLTSTDSSSLDLNMWFNGFKKFHVIKGQLIWDCTRRNLWTHQVFWGARSPEGLLHFDHVTTCWWWLNTELPPPCSPSCLELPLLSSTFLLEGIVWDVKQQLVAVTFRPLLSSLVSGTRCEPQADLLLAALMWRVGIYRENVNTVRLLHIPRPLSQAASHFTLRLIWFYYKLYTACMNTEYACTLGCVLVCVCVCVCVCPYCSSQTGADRSAVTGLKQQARKISEVGVKYD